VSIGIPSIRDGASETLSGTKTLVFNDARLQFLDPGGAGRSVVLPAETMGVEVVINNAADASEDLTVKEDGASTTIVVISQHEDAILTSDGTSWSAVLSKGAT
jgi:hypothetical protein